MNDWTDPIGDAMVYVSLPPAEAWAVATLLQRMGWRDCREHAVDDAEAHAMQQGLDRVWEAFREAGFDPR